MSISVTEAELLEALAVATKGGPDDAQTASEMADATGVERPKVMQALRVLHRQGRLQVCQVLRMSIAGKMVPVPAYTILPAKKKR